MNPETAPWFSIEDSDENPVVIIRNRLLNHGDLLNEGFDTNLALSIAHKKQYVSGFDTIYGEVLGENIIYSGIATLCKNEFTNQSEVSESSEEWLKGFLKNVWWTATPSEMNELMYFNPAHKSKNNYTAWDSSFPVVSDEVILGRLTINKNGYEYYLLKPRSKLMHRIDPFLQEQGYHIRIMLALRKKANNSVVAIAKKHSGYIHLKLSTHLPTKERTILESYAWPINRINDMLCWTMYGFIWEYIKPYLEALGIRITEE